VPNGGQAAGKASAVVANKSIGGISMGMTEKQVEQMLGKPKSRLTVSLGNGRQGRFARYSSHGAAFLVTYDASGRVVSMETYSPFFHTAGGVGPGSPITSAKALPGFHTDFCELGYWNGSARPAPGAVVTVFTPGGDHVDSVMITQYRVYTACEGATGGLPPPPVGVAPNRSIAGVAIDMTEAQVVKLYGNPQSTVKLSLGGGESGKFARYTVQGKPLLVTYDADGHVASIEAYSPSFKTAAGIGPGSSLTEVQTLKGFRPDYCELGYWNGTAHTRPTDVVTVFTPSGGSVASVLITQLRLYTACDTGSQAPPPTSP
jgi:hypothetical protein